jgi:hypothetical protein
VMMMMIIRFRVFVAIVLGNVIWVDSNCNMVDNWMM